MAKTLFIVCFSDLKRDPRVYRQILFLKDAYQIVTAGFGDPGIPGVDFLLVHRPETSMRARLNKATLLGLRRYESFYWGQPEVKSLREVARGLEFDLVVANDMSALPVSLSLAGQRGAKVLLDAHEYEPRRFDDRLLFRFFFAGFWDYICRRYLPRTDGMVTVGKGISEAYERNYGVASEVVTNAPFSEDLRPSPAAAGRIRMIHHGAVNATRRLDNMVHLMSRLDDRFTLDLMLMPGEPGPYRRLQRLAAREPRVRFRDPVPMTEIVRTVNAYDVGIHLMPPDAFNCRWTLGNKFFEFIQARLAVAIWPSPEMARYVQQYGCGVVSREFTVDSMAEALTALADEDIARMKDRADTAARDLNAEANREVMQRLVAELVG